MSGESTGSALSGGSTGSALSGGSTGSALSGGSAGSALSGSSAGSALSGGSAGSALSGGSTGSALSGGSTGSALSGGSTGSALSGSSTGSALSGSSTGSALSALQCHFTWDLSCSRSTYLRLLDKLVDICPGESTPWRAQSYNLQGFLQARLGRSSEALTLFRSASECLRGPGLLVNYGDLAWLHHERGEAEQSREYLRRVEALASERPSERQAELLAEKAWTVMKFSQQKLAAELLKAALEQEPECVEWRSCQVLALVSANKHNPDAADDQLLQKMQRAHEYDPENLYLSAEYLNQRGRRGEQVKDDMDDLANRIVSGANSSYGGLKVALRFYRHINQEDCAIFWADEALERHPDCRYVIRCAALCYKWRVLFKRDGASQRRLLDTAVRLTQKVIELYPDSALVKEMDLADLYSKSDRSKAEEMYRGLLKRQMEPSETQMLYNRYAKYVQYDLRNIPQCISYHKKAVLIEHESFFRENSRKAIEDLKKDGWAEELGSAQLQELQCHFTWELRRSEAFTLQLRDRLQDLLPGESAPWRAQSYNLQGFLQARLGRSSEALALFRSASECLRGPGLLVNYGDLAWLHHERGEAEQSREYLRRVEALASESPSERQAELLAEKAWTVMEIGGDHRLAARLFKEALGSEERVEWRSCYAVALLFAHNKHRDGNSDHILQEMHRAAERDPQNLLLKAKLLLLGRAADARAAGELAARLLRNPVTLHRDVEVVLELQRRAVSVQVAVGLAEEALQTCPGSRYLKACLAQCLKRQVEQEGEAASQDLIERAAALLRDVVSLYPDSNLKAEIDLANVYAKSNHSLARAERLYRDLLQRDLEPRCTQFLYHNYAKFMNFEMRDPHTSTLFHLKAAKIPLKSNCRANSIKVLLKVRSKCGAELRRDVEDFLEATQEM